VTPLLKQEVHARLDVAMRNRGAVRAVAGA